MNGVWWVPKSTRSNKRSGVHEHLLQLDQVEPSCNEVSAHWSMWSHVKILKVQCDLHPCRASSEAAVATCWRKMCMPCLREQQRVELQFSQSICICICCSCLAELSSRNVNFQQLPSHDQSNNISSHTCSGVLLCVGCEHFYIRLHVNGLCRSSQAPLIICCTIRHLHNHCMPHLTTTAYLPRLTTWAQKLDRAYAWILEAETTWVNVSSAVTFPLICTVFCFEYQRLWSGAQWPLAGLLMNCTLCCLRTGLKA